MKNLLIPHFWKYIGLSLLIIGIILCIFYIYFDFRFTMPVFAIYSSFIETKIFASFKTNFADELILLLLLIGLFLIMFSKEKNEEIIADHIRENALAKSIFYNIFFLLFSLIFVFGSGFLGILIINIFSVPILYIYFFYRGIYKAIPTNFKLN